MFNGIDNLAFRYFLAFADEALFFFGVEFQFGCEAADASGCGFLCCRWLGPDVLGHFLHVSLAGARKRCFSCFTFLVNVEFFADEVCGHFRHETVCHELAAGYGDESLDSVTFFVVEQYDASADVSAAGVTLCCHERSYACVGSQDSGVVQAWCEFFAFCQKQFHFVRGYAHVVALFVRYSG